MESKLKLKLRRVSVENLEKDFTSFVGLELGLRKDVDSFREIRETQKPGEFMDELRAYKRMLIDIANRAGTTNIIFAEVAGGIAGYCYYNRENRFDRKELYFLCGLYVKPCFRQYGIGTRMIDVLKKDAIQKGLSGILLAAGSEKARKYYDKLGFKRFSDESPELLFWRKQESKQ